MTETVAVVLTEMLEEKVAGAVVGASDAERKKKRHNDGHQTA